MLAPLRDYLSPKNPLSSPLLCGTKDWYFSRLLVAVDPDKPEFEETQWIISEDVNVEHLLDVFTSIDPNSETIWDACTGFMTHLRWHKPRLVILRSKIEAFPDDHPSKPSCLFWLSRLLEFVGSYLESKRLYTRALKLWRDRGDLHWVAQTLAYLSGVNLILDVHEEGVQQAKEALVIYEQLDHTVGQARCLVSLAQSSYYDGQLEAAKGAASRAIALLSKCGQQFLLCECHRLLCNVYHSEGDRGKAIQHLEVALGIASLNSHDQVFRIHATLVVLFTEAGRLDDAGAHFDRAKPHAVSNALNLAHVIELRAYILYERRRFEAAEFEVSCAVDAFERLGAVVHAESCRKFLDMIREKMESPVPSDGER
jgi:tetratricopeptide (TPR) repeat protein